MAQRSIRFPDSLEDRIAAEVARLGYPHTFTSVVVQTLDAGVPGPDLKTKPHREKRPSNFDLLQGVEPKQ